jgi:uracil-DNA glycosylase
VSETSDWEALDAHLRAVRGCRICPRVEPPPIAARPELWPRMILVGQAPGPKERDVGRPFAFTAGTRMFQWFARLGVSEEEFRRRVLICAVLRCFPGRSPQGGDRPPAPAEIAHCAPWLDEEIAIIRPLTVIAVGQPAIARFLPEAAPLHDRVGRAFPLTRGNAAFDLIPLPHPSGRSTWLTRRENQERLDRALSLLKASAGWRATFASPP